MADPAVPRKAAGYQAAVVVQPVTVEDLHLRRERGCRPRRSARDDGIAGGQAAPGRCRPQRQTPAGQAASSARVAASWSAANGRPAKFTSNVV